ncbi:unnamed protein product [Prorocentrum cordatum]|uniref:Uncharacterized protein n=1 Tax=Prorocentrum cordatum TaxID=2364126 RepID=A0ABN9WB00_9DINO|nr:unnamed protein product [Polarella glacialis]
MKFPGRTRSFSRWGAAAASCAVLQATRQTELTDCTVGRAMARLPRGGRHLPRSTSSKRASRTGRRQAPERQLGAFGGAATWSLEGAGLELLPLGAPDDGLAQLALRAGQEMAQIADRFRHIANGDGSRGRRQSYLRMRHGQRAPMSMTAAEVLEAAEALARERLGPRTVLNDCVVIGDFEPNLPRQELHRDIRREAVDSTTYGLLVPLSDGARLHVVPGSHSPRDALRGTFRHDEVVCVDVPPGWAALWDGMVVHAGDAAAEGTTHNRPNRLRLHAYAEQPGQERPFDDKAARRGGTFFPDRDTDRAKLELARRS